MPYSSSISRRRTITTSARTTILRKKYLAGNGLDVLLVDLMSAEQHNWDSPHRVHNGLRSLLSYIRSKQYSAELLFNLDPALSPRAARAHFIKEIIKRKPLFLGFSPYQAPQRMVSPDILVIEKIVNKLNQKGVFPYIILGGHFASFTHKELMNDFPWIDHIIRGEGEEALFELITAVKARQPLQGMLNLTFRKGNKVVTNGPRPNIKELDRLPFPALDSLDLVKAKGLPIKHLSLCSSRGCYGHCSFCSIQSFYGLSPVQSCWRAKSSKVVADEVELLARRYDCRVFNFMDDNFMGSGPSGQRRAVEIAQEIIKRNLNITFSLLCRSNDVEIKVMTLLKQAGLYAVEIGIESGSDLGLKTYAKGATVEQNKQALISLNDLGIKTFMDLIFFNPYSSLAEIKDNLNFLRFAFSLQNVSLLSERLFSYLQIYSGTRIKDRLAKDGLLKGDYIKGYYFKFKDKRLVELSKLGNMFNQLPEVFNAAIVEHSQDKQHVAELSSKKTAVCRDFALESIGHAIDLLAGPSPDKATDFIAGINADLINNLKDLCV